MKILSRCINETLYYDEWFFRQWGCSVEPKDRGQKITEQEYWNKINKDFEKVLKIIEKEGVE